MKKNIVLLFLISLFKVLSYAQPADKTLLLPLLMETGFYVESGNFEKAAKLQDEALVMFKELGSGNDLQTISELHRISHSYSVKKMYEKAVKTESLLVEIFPLALPNDTSEYAMYMNDLAMYQLGGGMIDQAEATINKAMSLIGDSHDLKLMGIYIQAAEIFKSKSPGRYDLAVRYQKKAVDAFAQAYGKTNPEYLKELGYLATYYEKNKEYENASDAYSELLRAKTGTFDVNNADSLLPLLDRIIICSRMCGKKEREEQCKQIALAILSRKMKFHEARYQMQLTVSDSLIRKDIMNRLQAFGSEINHFRKNGNNEKLQDLLDSRKTYIDQLPNTVGKAYALSTMSSLYFLINDNKGAVEYGLEAIRVFDLLGIKCDEYVHAHCYLATAFEALGNPAKAYDYALKAFELRDDYLSSDDRYYYGLLHDLAFFSSRIGKYEDAIRYSTMAVEARRILLYTDDSYTYFHSLNNLATYYGNAGYKEEELQIMEHLVEKIEEFEPCILDFPENPYLFNLASSYSAVGKYEKAIEIGLRVKEQRENYGHKQSLASIYSFLARTYRSKGELQEALSYVSKANNILKEIGGDVYLPLSDSYDLMAMIYKNLKDYPNAEKMEREAMRIVYNNVLLNFADLSSVDRTSFWDLHSGLFNLWYPNYFYEAKSEDASELYDKCALFAKGILLNADTEMTKLIMDSGDDSALSKYLTLLSNKAELTRLASKDVAEAREYSDSLKSENDRLERELRNECKVYGDFTRNMRTTWKDVRNALGPNDIALEFISFPLIDEKDEPNGRTLYLALTLRKQDNNPQYTILFEEAELDCIGADDLYGEQLYDLVWKPLKKRLDGVENVYFSPSGKLYGINIEVLPEIIGEKESRNFYRVSSTRELVHPRNSSSGMESMAAVYGGLNYNTSLKQLVADGKRYEGHDARFRGDIDSLDLRYGWRYLPGTLAEVRNIEEILRHNQVPLRVYTDTLGTEASFKSLDGQSVGLFHIATHGFYYSESDSARMSKAHLDIIGDLTESDSRHYVEDKSLTRSGLLFAGCNNVLTGNRLPDNLDDGVLFAKEIADMNLRGMEFITLSSCESGLGDISGEGVFGLQRAFKKAGAGSILMSLWKVDDEATRVLMTRFYENLFSRKLTKTESLREAQLFVRKYNDGIYSDPMYWAAFILLDAYD